MAVRARSKGSLGLMLSTTLIECRAGMALGRASRASLILRRCACFSSVEAKPSRANSTMWCSIVLRYWVNGLGL